MNATVTVDVQDLFREDAAPGPDDIEQFVTAIGGGQLHELRQSIRELTVKIHAGEQLPDAQQLRLGIALYLMGDHRRADSVLSALPHDGQACYHHGAVLRALGRDADAEQKYEQAAANGYDEIDAKLQQAGAIRAQGRLDEAEEVVRSVAAKGAGRAEYSYQMGCILADRGDTYGAIEYFERAVDIDPHHSQALFRLAAENALRGNDDDAIRLYEQSLSKPPLYLGALLNLGLLYEDIENYSAAAYCFRRVLDIDPNHQRARLYLRDIEATDSMYYDEESARQEARMQQLLGRPVTDFELSVRSRNCLQSMNLHTLGDLTRVSEQELLAGKNFGETSLHEIREIMGAHGLRIGQNLHEVRGTETPFQQQLSPQEQAVLNKPISELNLSVRARKCMTRLGITSVGDLVQRTPDELLASRNFGVTSLNEVRSKLSEMTLKLRND